MNKLQQLQEQYPDQVEESLKADGLDDAVIGMCFHTNRLIYSIKKTTKILTKQMIPDQDDIEEHGSIEAAKTALAIDHLYFNVLDAYVGKMTPIWLQDDL